MDQIPNRQPLGYLTVPFWVAVGIWIMVAQIVILDVSGIGRAMDDALGLGNEIVYIVPMFLVSVGGAAVLSRRFKEVPKLLMVGVLASIPIGFLALAIWG
ncbi:MAG: hypothetical protein ACR2N7_12760 [Acidimicrobiia bacterium]